MKRWQKMAATAMAAMAASASAAVAQVEVDPDLPDYEPASGVSGNINSVGSDTMNNMAALWAEGFIEMYPNVRMEIEGKGSSTAPTALTAGTSTFGPMSRAMRDSEIEAFEDEHGYPPTALPTSVDMLAVYVHRDNPIEGLSLKQVDAIFSGTRRGGHSEAITRWGQAGLEGDWANVAVSLYGRNSASGTYGYFKEHALFGGDYSNDVREQPGSSSVVQGVANERGAIGYSGIGYKTADVRAVPLKREGDPRYYEATVEDAGEYPMSRFLYLYVNHQPGSELDPLRREFVKYVYSKQGQEAVVRDGYIPVSARVARQALESLNIRADF